MLFVVAVLLIALLVLSPYIAVVKKRYKMLKRLTAVAHGHGFRVRRLHRLVCFSLNRGRRYDLLFENKACAYAVKLWSATRKNSTLVIKANGSFFVSSMASSPLETGAERRERRTNSRILSVPVTHNNFKVKKGKPVINILLYYPPYKEVILDLGARRRRIESGEKIFDKIFCVPVYFERILCESASEQRNTAALTEKENGAPIFIKKS